jgi:hypothetical protein
LSAQVPALNQTLLSGNQILWSSGDEPFKVINYLIRENLHGFPAGPGYVRSNNQIRQIQLKQRTAIAWRLFAQDV